MQMQVFPFVGPSYVYRSVNFDCQRTVNLYPVTSESQTSKAISGLQGAPGLKLFCQLPTAPNRGAHACLGRAFEVNGNKLYEILSDGTYAERGTLNTFFGLVSMADNGQQVVMVDGPYGYIFTLATNTFLQITSPAFLGATTVTYLDGYFIFNRPNTGIYYITALYDGYNIDALDFASAEGSPDNLTGLMAVHKELWLFGTNSIEVAFNSGAADFPFQRIQGAFIEYGCVAPGSISKTANTVFWLGQDDQGHGIVWMATGYQPQRISTFAVEFAIQQYANLTDATSYTYQEDGHYFYVLNFTEANTTWVYDINLNQWHERAYFEDGDYSRSRPQTHIFAFNKHLVGDYQNGKIYEQSLSYYDDAGQPKRWMRTAMHLHNPSLNYFYHKRLQIDMQTGTGLTTGAIQNTNPEVMLDWSDDGGHTWSNEKLMTIGKIGAYTWRAVRRMMGRSRDRVYRLAGTSNTKVFIIAAHLNVVEGSN